MNICIHEILKSSIHFAIMLVSTVILSNRCGAEEPSSFSHFLLSVNTKAPVTGAGAVKAVKFTTSTANEHL